MADAQPESPPVGVRRGPNWRLAIAGLLLCLSVGLLVFLLVRRDEAIDPAAASAPAVVEYLLAPRGFAALPVREQGAWLTGLFGSLEQPGRQQAIAAALQKADRGALKALAPAVFEAIRVSAVDMGRTYAELDTPNQQRAFIRAQYDQLERIERQLQLSADGQVDEQFRDLLPSTSEALRLVLERTSQADMQAVQELLNALQAERQRRLDRRAADE